MSSKLATEKLRAILTVVPVLLQQRNAHARVRLLLERHVEPEARICLDLVELRRQVLHELRNGAIADVVGHVQEPGPLLDEGGLGVCHEGAKHLAGLVFAPEWHLSGDAAQVDALVVGPSVHAAPAPECGPLVGIKPELDFRADQVLGLRLGVVACVDCLLPAVRCCGRRRS